MAGERDDSELNIPDVLAILPLRGTVIFPQAVMPLAVGRPASVRLIQEALQGSRIIGAVMQRDPSEDAPRAQGLHTIGTATVIEKALKLSSPPLTVNPPFRRSPPPLKTARPAPVFVMEPPPSPSLTTTVRPRDSPAPDRH